MDLFQLQNSIEYMEKKHRSSRVKFLGVTKFDTGQDLLANKTILNKCKKLFCDKSLADQNIYFMILNTSLEEHNGEHWFLLAFDSEHQNTFYIFNSFGIANTLKTFGFDNIGSNDNRNKIRIFALNKLKEYIWNNYEEEFNVIDLNGIQQDFSTDECGYHVIRFVDFLYRHIYDDVKKIINWKNILERYIYNYAIKLIKFDHKYMNREAAQSILLRNDLEVKQYVVEKILFDKKNYQISFHDEYKLTDNEWNSIAKKYIRIINSNFSTHIDTSYPTTNIVKMVRRVDELSIRKRRRNKSHTRQIKKKKKVVAKVEKRLVTYAETFDEMLANSQKYSTNYFR